MQLEIHSSGTLCSASGRQDGSLDKAALEEGLHHAMACVPSLCEALPKQRMILAVTPHCSLTCIGRILAQHARPAEPPNFLEAFFKGADHIRMTLHCDSTVVQLLVAHGDLDTEYWENVYALTVATKSCSLTELTVLSNCAALYTLLKGLCMLARSCKLHV